MKYDELLSDDYSIERRWPKKIFKRSFRRLLTTVVFKGLNELCSSEVKEPYTYTVKISFSKIILALMKHSTKEKYKIRGSVKY